MVHSPGDTAAGAHSLRTSGDWVWCTRRGGYANRVPRKLRTLCTAKIELCGQRALRWLREGRSPVELHELNAPFGTQPRRAFNIRPHAAGDTIEISDSDEDLGTRAERDAAEQRGVASTLIGQLLARIDNATSGIDTDAESDHWGGGADTVGPIWPGPDDMARTRIAARAHWAP